jgi:hypothetical protein
MMSMKTMSFSTKRRQPEASPTKADLGVAVGVEVVGPHKDVEVAKRVDEHEDHDFYDGSTKSAGSPKPFWRKRRGRPRDPSESAQPIEATSRVGESLALGAMQIG